MSQGFFLQACLSGLYSVFLLKSEASESRNQINFLLCHGKMQFHSYPLEFMLRKSQKIGKSPSHNHQIFKVKCLLNYPEIDENF